MPKPLRPLASGVLRHNLLILLGLPSLNQMRHRSSVCVYRHDEVQMAEMLVIGIAPNNHVYGDILTVARH